MTTHEAVDDLVQQFLPLTDWEDRYAHIMALGRRLPEYPEAFRTSQFLVRGCQSQVWLHPTVENGRLHFDADSDALIVKGLVAMLMSVYNDRTPEEILAIPTDFVARLGLDRHLSQNRANGLAAMMRQIHLYAVALRAAGGPS